VLARRGQGRFRQEVRADRNPLPRHRRQPPGTPDRQPLQTVARQRQRRAPGRENGLLLTPSIDHLFDRGFISFENSGELLVSRVAHEVSLRKMGVPVGGRFNAGAFSEGQRRYLEFHRESVFLQAVRR